MKNKAFLLLPILLLTSCGSIVNDLVPFGYDHGTDWFSNYYEHFDENYLNAVITHHELTDENIFRRYTDDNFKNLFPDYLKYDYENDYTETYDEEFQKITGRVGGYSQNYKLSKTNTLVKDGYASKLFDGNMFCHGKYEAARVQIKEKGCSVSFKKKLIKADYVALNLKSSLDFKNNKNITEHLDDIKLSLTFYKQSGSSYIGDSYSYSLKDIRTNIQGEATSNYVFYGFSLKNINIEGVSGMSISYTIEKESYNNEKGTNYAHALLLYELLLPNASWE